MGQDDKKIISKLDEGLSTSKEGAGSLKSYIT